MKIDIKIESFELKTSKQGKPYKIYKTDQGMMSCFEKSVIAELEANVGKLISVDMQERQNFKNIVAFYGCTVVEQKIVIAPVPVLQLMAIANGDKAKTMELIALYRELTK